MKNLNVLITFLALLLMSALKTNAQSEQKFSDLQTRFVTDGKLMLDVFIVTDQFIMDVPEINMNGHSINIISGTLQLKTNVAITFSNESELLSIETDCLDTKSYYFQVNNQLSDKQKVLENFKLTVKKRRNLKIPKKCHSC